MGNRMGGFLSRIGILGELLVFLWQRRLWWMMPMVMVLILFALLLVFAQASAVAPFIYTLF
jgi:drug/metabolite transporter superfamily protein YnfA